MYRLLTFVEIVQDGPDGAKELEEPVEPGSVLAAESRKLRHQQAQAPRHQATTSTCIHNPASFCSSSRSLIIRPRVSRDLKMNADPGPGSWLDL